MDDGVLWMDDGVLWMVRWSRQMSWCQAVVLPYGLAVFRPDDDVYGTAGGLDDDEDGYGDDDAGGGEDERGGDLGRLRYMTPECGTVC